MAGVKIHGAEYPLKDIFSDRFIFDIPPYQRPYSWSTEQAGELIEDLLGSMAEGNGSDPDPYFLGSIVLAKNEGDPHAQVIDGQQRLTTLTILLSAIAALAPEDEKADLRPFILQQGNKFTQTTTQHRVTLRPRDAEFFRKYVQEDGTFDELLKLDRGQLADPQANIQANAQLFRERLLELGHAERSLLGKFLLNHCFLVAVSTPDRDSAFRIFAVLNDRGLNLSAADIIKSEVIGALSETEQEEYTRLWESAEEELGTERFGEMFSHLRMIYSKSKQRAALLKEFREHVLGKVEDSRHFIRGVVAPYADIYARITTQGWESASNAEEINRWLGWLSRIDNADWVPPAIVFLHRHRQQPEKIAAFLSQLERLAASMYIRRVNINGRVDRYGRLLQDLEGGKDVLISGSALDLSEEEKAETVEQLGGQVYLTRRTRLYILLRLDQALSAGGAVYDHSIISVEHVLPQTPAQHSDWTRRFSEEERAQWTHRLANLVLLPHRKNSEAQNLDFSKKKEEYFTTSHGTSPFALTTQVLERTEWTPAVLEQRQKTVVGKLAEVWALTPGT